MSETQALLGKIAALRQQLEQAQGLVNDAGSAASALLQQGAEAPNPVQILERKVAAGSRQEALLEGSLRDAPGTASALIAGATAPPLTARAARLLPRVQELLAQLRGLADDPGLQRTDGQLLAALHRETAVLLDLVVRTLQTLPETPSIQLRLCEGVESILKGVAQRLDSLRISLGQKRKEHAQIDLLAELLTGLFFEQAVNLKPFRDLAEALQDEAAQGLPVRFLYADPKDSDRFAAAHSLTAAQVMARLIRHDPDWRNQTQRPLLAALLHDVGMLSVSTDILTHPGPLAEEEKRAVEGHAREGAALVARLEPEASWLIAAVSSHHERLDGTGYPAGLSDLQIEPIIRLLAVCDVYAALCCPRPHRPALDTRTALTDTLMMGQQGALDRTYAKGLLDLGLYPAGTVVELADGACGLVVATHPGRRDINACARPVVALLTDSQNQLLPFPAHLDLAECEGRSIVRSLPAEERRRLLGERYPQWA